MKNQKFKIIWGYAVELIFASIALIILCLIFDPASISNFIRQTAVDLATLFCAILFAAALAFLWTFYSKADTEFYHWLNEHGSLTIYIYATGYAVGIEATATILLIITKQIADDRFILIALYFLLMAAINGYTLICNVVDLMKLNVHFNQVKKSILK